MNIANFKALNPFDSHQIINISVSTDSEKISNDGFTIDSPVFYTPRLEKMTNLKSLKLIFDENVKSLSFLSSFNGLEELYLISYLEYSTYDPKVLSDTLLCLTSVKTLSIDFYAHIDISDKCPNAETVVFVADDISSILRLKNLHALKISSISEKLNFSGIGSFKELRKISISDFNDITGFYELTECPFLEYMHIDLQSYNGKAIDFSALEQIKELSLTVDKLEDFSCISEMKSLKKLTLSVREFNGCEDKTAEFFESKGIETTINSFSYYGR